MTEVAKLRKNAETRQRKSEWRAATGEELYGEALPMPAPNESLGSWDKFIGEFHDMLRARGFSHHTIEHYVRSSRRFAAWILENDCKAPIRITPTLCMEYQRAVYFGRSPKGEMYSIATQIQLLSAVRSFTAFLKRSGYALVDPGLAIQLPRAPKRLPRGILTEEEIAKVLSIPKIHTARGYRDRTILEVLYATGMRSGELLKLNTDDFDPSPGRMRILEGKGGKDRWVPLGNVATDFVSGYIQRIRPLFLRDPKQRALFLTRRGMRMAYGGFPAAIQEYFRAAGIEWRVVPHSFRHTCATHMLKNGANIRHIQELLGHESLETTERYTQVEIGDLCKVHEQFHPRERL